MFAARFATAVFTSRRMLSYTPIYGLSHMETVSSFMRANPLQNNLAVQNMREMILGRRDISESELSELVTINELLKMVLRGTLSVKSQN